jgi:hypothetical protein
MQLHLEPDRQAVFEHPIGEITRCEVGMARRKQHGATLCEPPIA